MVACTKSQQRKEEDSKRLRGERDQIILWILDLRDGKLQDPGEVEKGKKLHRLHVLGMDDDLWVRY